MTLYLNEKVEDAKWYDDNCKSWCGNRYHKQCTDYSKESKEKHTNGPRDDLINGVDVLRETVENSAEGSGVKK